MISVVLATHNEQKNLAKCLASVQDLVDEIIVVDGESTDETVKIAKQFKAKVISTTNKPVFHINKQMAMDEAKGELVLQLDADEVVDAELKKFILQTHQQILEGKSSSDLPVAWWIKRKNFFLNRFLTKGGQYPDPVIRLYQRGKASLPQKDVHEQMIVDGEVGWADGHLLHYSSPDFSTYIKKWNAYSSLQAQHLADEGVKPGILTAINYLLVKPSITFFLIYFRHKGFMDGWPGFVFAEWSGLFHAVSYLKMWELRHKKTRSLDSARDDIL